MSVSCGGPVQDSWKDFFQLLQPLQKLQIRLQIFVHVRKLVDRLPGRYYGIQLSSMVLHNISDPGDTLTVVRDRILAAGGLNKNRLEHRCLQNLDRRIRNQTKKLSEVGLVSIQYFRPPGSLIDHIRVNRKFRLPKK